jgi:ATP-dependent DNA helicase RecG
MGLNERQIKAVMYVKERGKITIADYKEISPDVSEKTLYRDLQELVKKKILHEIGDKKGRRYELL